MTHVDGRFALVGSGLRKVSHIAVRLRLTSHLCSMPDDESLFTIND
jgi:hypothetical protein